MTASDAKDLTIQAAELRDAAINASASAWRITGLEARSLIKSGEEYERPVSLDELACLSSDSLGWGAQGQTAQRIAEAWARAAEAWHAADLHARGAQAVAIVELRRQQTASAESLSLPEREVTRQHAQLGVAREERPESFRILNGKSYRAARRPSAFRHEAAEG
jgi:hypothetical protein